MALLPIREVPDPVLRRKAEPVRQVDDATRRLLDDMLATMYDAPGIGLAAPQVGVNKRLAVIDITAGEERTSGNPLYLINPEIIERSVDKDIDEEGCLSLPGQTAEVLRPIAISLTYLDRGGQTQEMRADGLLARCIQHEIDHLDGVLFVDHLSALKRKMILRRMSKRAKERQRGAA